jgi:hypothetical protein
MRSLEKGRKNTFLSVKASSEKEIEAVKEKNQSLQNQIDEISLHLEQQLTETRENFQKQIDDYAKQSVKMGANGKR